MAESKKYEIISSLVSFGLTPVQAQAYITLLTLHKATAKLISKNSDVNRVNIYKALRRLKKLGLVEETLGMPTEFSPVNPDEALEILISSKLRGVEQLEQTKKTVAGEIQDFVYADNRAYAEEEEVSENELSLKMVWGEQMFRRVQSVIANAKEEIMMIFAPSVMMIYDRIGIPAIHSERQRKGIRVRAITKITPENTSTARPYSLNAELRHNELPSTQMRYTIVDRKLLILSIGDTPHAINEGTALLTNSKVLVTALVKDFETIWESSIPSRERIQELKHRVK